eukprot:Gregarina_sp_Poly_1__6624@NODE_355_length_9287_cov_174_942082_g296_i0_p2_GENE_NODE_355_length_9287_cov_174_942082_g296_i0NODE_355_length_9287_cov_174_942082_g296_i0_p2_ORF_typecomplete_len1176_score140_23Bot1p/PF12298_8/0_15DnaB_2/PF07261_11/0_24HEAT_2/PF13646_6/6_1e03HEAT_2/PF13646_6/3_9HEAT_2/PF13646_6/2_7e03HEAT_2/PF13646_6/1_8e03_NODE_355_length_9287_cov_174_942082_g296_i049148441
MSQGAHTFYELSLEEKKSFLLRTRCDGEESTLTTWTPESLIALCESGSDWPRRFWTVELFTFYPSVGKESEAVLHVSHRDESKSIRHLALNYVATHAKFYTVEQIQNLLDVSAFNEKKALLLRMRRKHHFTYLDAILSNWQKISSGASLEFLFYGSDEFVGSLPDVYFESIACKSWGKLARFHPRCAFCHFLLLLDRNPIYDPSLWMIGREIMRSTRSNALTGPMYRRVVIHVARNFHNLKHLTGFLEAMKRISRFNVEDLVQLIITNKSWELCDLLHFPLGKFIAPKKIARWVASTPETLEYIDVSTNSRQLWIETFWTHLNNNIAPKELDLLFSFQYTHHILSKLPQRLRFPLLEKLLKRKWPETQLVRDILTLGPFEPALERLQRAMLTIGSEDERHYWLIDALKILFLRHTDQLHRMKEIVTSVYFTRKESSSNSQSFASNWAIASKILECIAAQPLNSWNAEIFPAQIVTEICDANLKAYSWRQKGRATPIYDWERRIFTLAVRIAPTIPEFSIPLFQNKFSDAVFISLLPSFQSHIPLSEELREVIICKAENLPNSSKNLSSSERLSLCEAILQFVSGRKNTIGVPALWTLLDLLCFGDFLNVEPNLVKEADKVFGLISKTNPDLFQTKIISQVTQDFNLLSVPTVSIHIFQFRKDIVARFFEGTLKGSGYLTRGFTNSTCVKLGGPRFLRYLAAEWQIKYAEALVKSMLASEGGVVPCDHGVLKLLASMPAVPWKFIIDNVVEFSQGCPEWLSRRGVRALAHLDDDRIVHFLIERIQTSMDSDALYAVAPSVACLPSPKALEIIEPLACSKISMQKEIVRLLGLIQCDAARKKLQERYLMPETHSDVKVAILASLFRPFHLSSSLSFLESVLIKNPTTPGCKHIISLNLEFVSVQGLKIAVQATASMLEKSLYVRELLLRLEQHPMGDSEQILVQPCLSILKSDSENRCSCIFALLQFIGFGSPRASEIVDEVAKFPDEWFKNVPLVRRFLGDSHWEQLLQASWLYGVSEKRPTILATLIGQCESSSYIIQKIREFEEWPLIVLLVETALHGKFQLREEDRTSVESFLVNNSIADYVLLGCALQLQNGKSVSDVKSDFASPMLKSYFQSQSAKSILHTSDTTHKHFHRRWTHGSTRRPLFNKHIKPYCDVLRHPDRSLADFSISCQTI